jgi:hypothetical protein
MSISIVITATMAVATNNGYTVNIIQSQNPEAYEQIVKIIKARKAGAREAAWEVAEANDPIAILKKKVKSDRIAIKDGHVFIDGRDLADSALDARIYDLIQSGHSISRMIKFFDRVKANPSPESVKDIFTFLEKNRIEISERGELLTYKKVRRKADGTMWDCHNGTVEYKIGVATTMKRSDCDHDRNSHCSRGLHISGWGYSFNGDVKLLCAIDPADVVAVPTDHNGQKMRACKVTPLCEYNHSEPLNIELVSGKARLGKVFHKVSVTKAKEIAEAIETKGRSAMKKDNQTKIKKIKAGKKRGNKK